MNNIEKSVVIVGAIASNERYSFYGTGFIVSSKDKAYVVTCRHVASMSEDNKIRFITYNPTKTTTITNALKTGDPIFYNSHQPYVDLAVLEILDFPPYILIENGIEVVSIDDLENINIDVPTDKNVIAIGFPMDYVEKQTSENEPDIRMDPLIATGQVANLKFIDSSFRPDSEDGDSYVLDSMKALIVYSKLSGGMSGSPVIEKDTKKLCGILFAGNNDFKYSEHPLTQSVFLFVPASFIIGLFNRIQEFGK